MFCLKISVVICVQKHSHCEFVHPRGGEKEGGPLYPSALASRTRDARVKSSHRHMVDFLSTGEKGGLDVKAKAFKWPNWPNLKSAFFFL